MSGYTITPLAAAIVDALPDRKAVAAVKRKYNKTGKWPTSTIFPTEQSLSDFDNEAVNP